MSRAAAISSAFSQQVVRAVEQLRDLRGMTNTQLIRASGLSANYFYVRLRGEGPYNTNDLEKLADALDIDPHEILQLAESPELAANDPNRLERIDGPELARRLTVLTKQTEVSGGFDPNNLVAHARDHGVAFEIADWPALFSHASTARVAVLVLDTVAEYFQVDSRYLRATRDHGIAVFVENRLALQRALVEAGATPLNRQDLEELAPEHIDALVRSVRSIPPARAQPH